VTNPLRLILPASSVALLALAFVAAPHSCAWGLATYFWAGVALILGQAVATFVSLRGRTTARRVALAGLAALSVVETQLGYLEFVAFNPIHHAVLIRDPA
jgi:Na+/proline symporter